MATLPKSIAGMLDFARAHRPIWAAQKDLLQLSQQAIDDLIAALAIAEQDRADSVSAKEAALAATAQQNASMEVLEQQLRRMLRSINAAAANHPDPGAVLRAAQIPARKMPEDLEAPPAPDAVTAELIAGDGAVMLMWSNPEKDAFIGKTVFKVYRAMSQPIAGTGLPAVPFTFIGLASSKVFRDEHVPIGYRQALYQVIATRNGFDSPASMPAIVKFGTAAGEAGEAALVEAA